MSGFSPFERNQLLFRVQDATGHTRQLEADDVLMIRSQGGFAKLLRARNALDDPIFIAPSETRYQWKTGGKKSNIRRAHPQAFDSLIADATERIFSKIDLHISLFRRNLPGKGALWEIRMNEILATGVAGPRLRARFEEFRIWNDAEFGILFRLVTVDSILRQEGT